MFNTSNIFLLPISPYYKQNKYLWQVQSPKAFLFQPHKCLDLDHLLFRRPCFNADTF